MTFPNADSRHGQTSFNPGQYSYCDHFWVSARGLGIISTDTVYLCYWAWFPDVCNFQIVISPK
jgi:hypothetical protein